MLRYGFIQRPHSTKSSLTCVKDHKKKKKNVALKHIFLSILFLP